MLGLVCSLGLRNPQQIIFHSDDVNRLRRRPTSRGLQARKIVFIDERRKQRDDQQPGQTLHAAPRLAILKISLHPRQASRNRV